MYNGYSFKIREVAIASAILISKICLLVTSEDQQLNGVNLEYVCITVEKLCICDFSIYGNLSRIIAGLTDFVTLSCLH